MKQYRTTLKDIECEALDVLLSATGMSCWAMGYVTDEGEYRIEDLEGGEDYSLRDGLEVITEGIAYPAAHDGLSPEQAEALADLLIELELVSISWKKWFMKEDK